jgi:hypothetical protein
MRTFIISMLLVIGGSACAPATVLYTPGSLATGHGDVRVDKFRYRPAESGRVAPNQIANTAMGSLKISDNVDEYFSNALKSELKYAGFSLGRGDLTLTGVIEDFTADDIGYSIDWKLVVVYRLRHGDSVVYEKPITVAHKASKFVEPLTGLNKSIRMSFDRLMEDPKMAMLVRSGVSAAPEAKPTAAR